MSDAENRLRYVTTMVCVAVKGVPTIGIIYRPFACKIGIYVFIPDATCMQPTSRPFSTKTLAPFPHWETVGSELISF